MESTNNFLQWVDIKNFKSIKDLRFDCKRVNVFIGKPNVGKSNILEGLGLLGPEYAGDSFLKNTIRYSKTSELFYDNNTSPNIEVTTDKGKCLIRSRAHLLEQMYEAFTGSSLFVEQMLKLYPPEVVITYDDADELLAFYLQKIKEDNSGFDVVSPSYHTFMAEGRITDRVLDARKISYTVKKFDYRGLTIFPNQHSVSLIPPDGSNLFAVLRRHKELLKEFSLLFEGNQQELVLDLENSLFELQRRESFYAIKYPYANISDTFKRFIFYLAAIDTNTNAILLFEEPEVHSFPPYVQTLAFRMIENDTNQYFIATHSPYLLQTLIEHLNDDQLNVFITYYQDYQTKVRLLTTEELSEVQRFSIDLFYNLRRFEPPVNA
ncbi:ATP/GTP-binding protein [Nibrella viscosa]|uniref:ATP/GTP-binding protein n=1 Tax=Nibrella viscosa TaxID=1084524 RepID=A0ABP8K0F9_9BACT